MCWTTTYARCGALALTQVGLGDAVAAGDELAQATIRTASIALAHGMCLRTVNLHAVIVPVRAAQSRPPGASVPLRADGSPVRAFRSPGLRIAAPVRLPRVL